MEEAAEDATAILFPPSSKPSTMSQEEIDKLIDELFDTPEATDLLAFFHDRLKVFLKDQGIRHDIIDACIAMPGNDDLTLLVKRATALSDTLKTEDGANLLQGYKRANNILTAEEKKDGVEYSFGADPKFAETVEETALFTALDAAEARITPAMAAEDFGTAMAGDGRSACPDRRLFRRGADQRRQPHPAPQPAEPAQPHPHHLLGRR